MSQGKITKCRADDMPNLKNSGWSLNMQKAFKSTDPASLAKMEKLPELEREDYKDYLRKHNIPYEFWINKRPSLWPQLILFIII